MPSPRSVVIGSFKRQRLFVGPKLYQLSGDPLVGALCNPFVLNISGKLENMLPPVCSFCKGVAEPRIFTSATRSAMNAGRTRQPICNQPCNMLEPPAIQTMSSFLNASNLAIGVLQLARTNFYFGKVTSLPISTNKHILFSFRSTADLALLSAINDPLVCNACGTPWMRFVDLGQYLPYAVVRL